MESSGAVAFDRKLNFGEKETLELNIEYLRRDLANLKVAQVQVLEKEKLGVDAEELDTKKAESAVPGQPTYRLVDLQ